MVAYLKHILVFSALRSSILTTWLLADIYADMTDQFDNLTALAHFLLVTHKVNSQIYDNIQPAKRYCHLNC